MTRKNLASEDSAEVLDESDRTRALTRRTALSLLGLSGLGAISSGSATAQGNDRPPFYNWQEDVDANQHTLTELGALSTKRLQVTGTNDINITVPSDFGTVTEAFEEASKVKLPSGVRAIVTIESGHKIRERIVLSNGDWSPISITSEDTTVPIDETADFGTEAIIEIEGAIGPHLETVIDCTGHDHDGVYIRDGKMTVAPDCGVTDAGRDNVYCYGGRLFASSGVFTDAGRRGIYLERQSSAVFSHADLSRCGEAGVTLHGVSQGMGRSAIINDCGERAVAANQASRVNVQGAELNSTKWGALASQFAVVDVRNAYLENEGEYACFSRRGGRVVADRTTINDPGTAAHYVEKGGLIHASSTKGNANNAVGSPYRNARNKGVPPVPIQEGRWTRAGMVISEKVPDGEASWNDHALHVCAADQNLTAGTQHKVEFGEVKTDPQNRWDETNNEYMIGMNGLWRIRTQVGIRNGNDGDTLRITTGVNNSPASLQDSFVFEEMGTIGDKTVQAERTIPGRSGDTVAVWVENSDSDCNLSGLDGLDYLQIEFVRPLHPDER